MKKKVTLFFGLILIASSVTFASDWDNALTTDRPDAAEASVTVDKYQLQIETSVGFDYDKSGGAATRALSFPTLFRFGLFNNFEFRIESPMITSEKETAMSRNSGFSDLDVGFKAHLWDQEGARPSVGLLTHLTLPTGKNSLSSNSLEPAVKLLADWDLTDRTSLGTNIGWDLPRHDDAGVRDARFLYAAAYGIALPILDERLGMFLEFAGAVPMTLLQTHEHFFDSGFTYLITPNLQVDIVTSFGLNDDATDFSGGVGISWRVN
jgi:hypothetical protein